MITLMAGLNGLGGGRFARFSSGLALILLFLDTGGVRAAEAPKTPLPGADIFEGTNVVHLSITVPPEGVRVLQRYHWGHGAQEKPEVKATVTEGKTVYQNVAVSLKGSAGSFRPFDNKPGLTLKFDKLVPGQKFHGLQKISLNNSVQDPTYLEEKICREMYEAAGVPAPRSDFAVVTLNGRKLGLYVLAEGYNKQFLKRYFKNVSGNLYDGGFCQEINNNLEVDSGDKPNDKSDLRKLMSAAASARQNNSLSALSEILDMERFLTMVALEVIQCHWDGYTMNRNNYRLYHDMDAGKMIFMPHGMDQMFGTGERSTPQSPIIPPMNGFVTMAVLGTSEGRTRYLQKLAEVRTNVFKVEEITARVRQIEERIRPFIDGRYSRRRGSVEWLCQNIVARAESIDEQLADPPQPASFTNGILRVANWRPRNIDGNGQFDIATSKDGKKLLHVTANGESAASSWRARVTLPNGRYQLEGYTRTRGVGEEAQSGAHLRISGTVSEPVLRGDAEWTMLSYRFQVREPLREVELVCELKGDSGEAWFDTSSLKVRRLQ